MPATITHAYFAKDVLDSLPKDIKNCISESRIKMFGQSTDSLLFYRLFSIRRGKQIRKMQKYFHENHSQEFFIYLIDYIKNHHLVTDIDTCSFLCGFICHYALDSTIHPYIFYKTGDFKKEDPATYKYNNVHSFMEIFLDNDLIHRREKTNPYSFPIGKFCFDLRPFSEELKRAIDDSFLHTFHIQNMGDIYYHSLKQMKYSLSLFRRDVWGMKKNIYKLVDTITPKCCFRFEAISYHYPLQDTHHFLNEEHQVWRNPIQYQLTSTLSYYELYIKALKLAKRLIESTFSYLNKEDTDLKKVFDNRSYVTGLDCNLKKELKYFEF